MPSKHFRSNNPAVSGGGGGSVTLSVPSFTYDEAATTDDALVLKVANPEDASADDALALLIVANPENASTADDITLSTLMAEDFTADDAPVIIVANPEDASVDDIFATLLVLNPENASTDDALFSAIINASYAEDSNVNDLTKVNAVITDPGRSGTPASDILQETEVVEALPTSNFGNQLTFRTVSADVLSANEIIGFLEVDFTKLTGMVAEVGHATPFSLTITISHNGLVAADIVVNLRRHTAKPFVEDSVTWNTQPSLTLGTNMVTFTPSIPNGAPTTFTVTLTESQLNSTLTDGWLYITFTDNDNVLRPVFTMQSREETVVSTRPQLNLRLQKGT